MTSFLRQHFSFFGVLGAGVCVGIGGTILYFKITNKILREIHQLNNLVSALQSEVQELKSKLETRRKRRNRVFYSVHASSGDDDEDLYEDAYSGISSSSEFESVKSFPLLSDIDGEQNDTVISSSTEKSAEEIYKAIDDLLDGEDKRKAFAFVEDNKSKYLTDPDFQWRLAKCTYQMAQEEGAEGNTERKKELIYSAHNTADKAVRLDDNSANAHKWFAITIGSIGDYEGTQEKIKNGYVFKDHISKAVALKPDDPSNHHLLGRWCYGVYMLSWIERKAAATLYATPPTSTADEALQHFLKAEELNPGKWKENMLFIGQCYIQKSQYTEAVKWLEKASKIPTVSVDDKKAQEEINTLLNKYR